MSELLKARELAEYLGKTELTLTDWRYKGTGPAYIKINGRSVRYRRSDVEAWLDAQTVKTEA